MKNRTQKGANLVNSLGYVVSPKTKVRPLSLYQGARSPKSFESQPGDGRPDTKNGGLRRNHIRDIIHSKEVSLVKKPENVAKMQTAPIKLVKTEEGPSRRQSDIDVLDDQPTILPKIDTRENDLHESAKRKQSISIRGTNSLDHSNEFSRPTSKRMSNGAQRAAGQGRLPSHHEVMIQEPRSNPPLFQAEPYMFMST